ncbi:hypothetical protein AB0A69_01570 [Streptomyces sp. NPDC045431]|uniref:hypothetical protein n=1 Tax=Streptomyces sp. NPDC045431 TaxID=3155613 RepID=UPI0033C906D2
MDDAPLAAVLIAEEEFPGIDLHAHDAWLVRDGAVWLVAEAGDEIVVGRVAEDPARVFAERRRWPVPRAGRGHGFASPLPDGGLAVSGGDTVTVYAASGQVRWTYEHQPWADQRTASAACTADASGHRLIATMAGPMEAGEPYGGDLCVALDLSDGRRLREAVLPSASAGYVFQQSLTDPGRLLLNAAQGDTFFSLVVTSTQGVLRAEPLGLDDELFAGVGMHGAVLKLDVGGAWLSRYEPGRADVSVDAEDVLPEDLVFAGHRPGFLDEGRVLVAVAEEQGSAETRHVILDGRTLHPVAELDYPGTDCFDPLALGDGTWLTVEGDTVRRWRTGAH